MTAAPELVARFQTDAQGQPEFVESPPGRKHYRIVVEVRNPPRDTLAATFELDPTYYIPIRTVEPGHDGTLQLETTAYGDYPLRVNLRSKSGATPVQTTLRKALLVGEQAQQTPSIGAAIAEIAEH